MLARDSASVVVETAPGASLVRVGVRIRAGVGLGLGLGPGLGLGLEFGLGLGLGLGLRLHAISSVEHPPSRFVKLANATPVLALVSPREPIVEGVSTADGRLSGASWSVVRDGRLGGA